MESIRGIIARVLRHDEETGSLFALVRYETPTGMVEGKLSASRADLRLGDFFVADGNWKTSSYKGRTEEIFTSRSARPDLPRTKEGAAKWFSAIFDQRHGATPDSIKAFVDKHGDLVASKCEQVPETILGVSARPSENRNAILTDWGRRISGRRAVNLMEACRLDPAAIIAVLDAFRDSAFDTLQRNPYRAARVKNVGFKNADRIGTHIGVTPDDARRVAAALVESLEEVRREGHTFAKLGTVGRMMEDGFGISVPTASSFIVGQMGVKGAQFVVDEREGSFVAQIAALHEGERSIADGVTELLSRGRRHGEKGVKAVVDRLFAQEKFSRFDDIQRRAVETCAREPFSILTGGPGTGKSTVTEVVVAAAKELDAGEILLCAPTGKAAKRLEETTGRKAVTIHRMLGAREDKANGTTVFTRNRRNPLPAGCVVFVDEASMMDVTTARALVDAMPRDGRLVLVGDKNQLPSVDAGSVLADLLSARDAEGRSLVPQAELVNVYRQGRDSRIATGAAMVRDGELPEMSNKFMGGLALYELPGEEIVGKVKSLVRAALDKGFAPHHIAVLVPQNPSTAGAWEINRALSAMLNPRGRQIPGVFRSPGEEDVAPLPRVGDRVMLTENDDENDVMNGDVGTIVDAFPKATLGGAQRNFVKVAFDSGRTVEYPAAKWRSFVLAYAITIHKSQGSQYPVVIMPVTMAHQGMLDRSLLYTGWTRAKTALFLVGEREALQASVETTDASKRDTRLSEFVVESALRAGLSGREGTREAGTASATGGASVPSTARPALPKPRAMPVMPVRPRPPALVAHHAGAADRRDEAVPPVPPRMPPRMPPRIAPVARAEAGRDREPGMAP